MDHSNLQGARAPQAKRARAIVMGASMAGLLAARVLREHFDEVVLIERDALPAGDANRKGVPQGVHAHGLLARGREILEQLFPGFTDELAARGARIGDLQANLAFVAGRRRFCSATAGVTGLAASRALIEGQVRRRLLAEPGVRPLTETDVTELLYDRERQRVTGVRVVARGDGAVARDLAADLVVDATGRGSRMPQWLTAWGFEAPFEERVQVGLRYATCYFRRSDPAPETAVALCSAVTDQPRPGVLIAQEGERWVVTLGGYAADAPPLEFAAFRQQAQSLPSRELAAVVRDEALIEGPLPYRFPFSQRRRYEQLKQFPAGLLVMGDALCSFNPIYGQGMSVAACEALALDACLARAGGALGATLAHRFFRAAARVVDTPWALAVGADLAIPQVEGPRPASVRFINWYVDKLFVAAERDANVARAFLEVAHLRAAPPTLFRPAVVARVVRGNWQARRERRQSMTLTVARSAIPGGE
jgi:2-polyprenyl-6-methoxyphenol hydroxylase-like FAD-dependent oxidoreductase